jgi:hypothetical protein
MRAAQRQGVFTLIQVTQVRSLNPLHQQRIQSRLGPYRNNEGHTFPAGAADQGTHCKSRLWEAISQPQPALAEVCRIACDEYVSKSYESRSEDMQTFPWYRRSR